MSTPDDDAGSHSPQLETEKWAFERECRLHELALKERDQANKDREVKLRENELRASTWRNPLVVAILAAAVAGLGNAVVAFVNGSLQRDLENNKRVSEQTLERSKAESSRILEMIKTGDNDKAASNLDFLIQSGLLTDDVVIKKLTEYLQKRTPGTGPSLPGSNSRFTLDSIENIDSATQEALQTRLNKYLIFLDEVGFPPSKLNVRVQIEAKPINNAYYDGAKVIIDKRLASDPWVALREYTHHILGVGFENQPWTGQYAAVESGLADYFAASFLGDPRVGVVTAKVLKTGQAQLRMLNNNRTFEEFKKLRDFAVNFEGAEIWGGLFWKLRTDLGAHDVDRLLADSWRAAATSGRQFTAESFIVSVLEASKKLGTAKEQLVRATLAARRFPVPQ